MQVNTRYINPTRGTASDIPLMEFMYLIFTYMPYVYDIYRVTQRMYLFVNICIWYICFLMSLVVSVDVKHHVLYVCGTYIENVPQVEFMYLIIIYLYARWELL